MNAANPAEEGSSGEGQGAAAAAAAAAAPAAESSAAAPKLATFALRIKAPDVLDQFVAAVNAHKAGGKKEADGAAAGGGEAAAWC